MSHYIIELELNRKGLAESGSIKGLKTTFFDGETMPDTHIHIAHHDFDIVWSETQGCQVSIPANKFYGGLGEGRSYDTFEDALLGSLYDEYQVNGQLKNGDTFECTYRDHTHKFRCLGIDVIHEHKPRYL